MALSMETTYFSSNLECIIYRRMGHRESLRSRTRTLSRGTFKEVQNAIFLVPLFHVNFANQKRKRNWCDTERCNDRFVMEI